MKRTILIWLMATAALCAKAYDFESDGVYYDVTSPSEVAVTAGEQPYDGYFTLPGEVVYNGATYQVTAIGRNAFRECYSLVGVVLPQGLKTIGDSAFFCCTRLAAMQFPEGLQTIGDEAFYGCSGLYAVHIPASVTSIGSEAFLRCNRLLSFKVAERNACYSAPDGVLMDKQQTRLIAYPNQRGTDYVVPTGVTEISHMAFVGCQRLQTVTLPEGLLSIGDGAFYGCAMLKVAQIPSSVERVGAWAFSECEQLSSVTLGTAVADIGEGAFSFCPRLQSIRVSTSNSSFCSVDDVLLTKDQRTIVACPGARQKAYRMPATVETIGEGAFYGCNGIESVTLPAALSALGDNPFVFCDGLKEILVSSDHPGLTSSQGVLMNKEQTAILFYPNAKEGAYTVPGGVTTLTCGPFMGSRQLTSLTIPAGVTSIDHWAFMGCDQLLSVSLPPTLQTLGERVFLDCTHLRTVICSAEPQPTDAFAPENFVNTTLYVPRGSEDQFRLTEGWGSFSQVSSFGIYADEQAIKRGRWYRLPICTSGPLHLSSLQMDVTLPEALEIAVRDDGSYLLEMADGMRGSVSCVRMTDGRYRVTMSTDDQRGLKTDADTLLFMGLRGTAEGDPGVRDLLMQDISIAFASDVHEGEARQPDQVMALDLQVFLGDVNRNGQLNVADLVETYRYLSESPTPNFHFSEADVNQNGKVNIADAMRTVDLLHEEAPLVAREWFWDGTASADQLQPADLSVRQGAEARLHIALKNTVSNYTAHQFQLLLPAGLQLAVDDDGLYRYETSLRYTDATQAVYVAEVSRSDSEGTLYHVVCASPSVATISQHDGDLLTFTVACADDQPLGRLEGQLRRIVFADADAAEYAFEDARFTVMVEEDTGIAELNADNSAFSIQHSDAVYNLSGHRVTHPHKGIYIINGRKVVNR